MSTCLLQSPCTGRSSSSPASWTALLHICTLGKLAASTVGGHTSAQLLSCFQVWRVLAHTFGSRGLFTALQPARVKTPRRVVAAFGSCAPSQVLPFGSVRCIGTQNVYPIFDAADHPAASFMAGFWNMADTLLKESVN